MGRGIPGMVWARPRSPRTAGPPRVDRRAGGRRASASRRARPHALTPPRLTSKKPDLHVFAEYDVDPGGNSAARRPCPEDAIQHPFQSAGPAVAVGDLHGFLLRVRAWAERVRLCSGAEGDEVSGVVRSRLCSTIGCLPFACVNSVLDGGGDEVGEVVGPWGIWSRAHQSQRSAAAEPTREAEE